MKRAPLELEVEKLRFLPLGRRQFGESLLPCRVARAACLPLSSAEVIQDHVASHPCEPAAETPLGARRVEARDARRAVPGYGHPLHKRQDPRVERLLAVAAEAGVAGRHVAAARAVEKLLPEVTGKPLVMNVSGAIAAAMLDAGFPLAAVKGVPLLARTASLIAHLVEEQERPIGFLLADSGAAAVSYDGPSPPGFVPTP